MASQTEALPSENSLAEREDGWGCVWGKSGQFPEKRKEARDSKGQEVFMTACTVKSPGKILKVLVPQAPAKTVIKFVWLRALILEF